jgi:hypothetical protein
MNTNGNGDSRSKLTRRQMISGTASALAILGASGSLAAQPEASAATHSQGRTEAQNGATKSIIDTFSVRNYVRNSSKI